MKKSHLLMIGILFIFYAVNNFFWLSLNKLSVTWDEGVHLWMDLRFAKAFINPAHDIFYDLLHADIAQWPPLLYFISGIFNLIFGTSYIVSVMTNMLFFLMLIVSLYLIGKRIHSALVGILAVIILSLYPVVYGYSRLFLLDFALMAIVTFSIYCLIETDSFKNFNWSIAFGISAGFGMLIKWSYVFFVLPSVLFVIIASLGIKKEGFLSRIKNLCIAGITALFIASLWYFMNTERSTLLLVELADLIGKNDWHVVEATQWFIMTLNNNMISFLFFSVLLISLAVFYIKLPSKFKLFITVWYAVPLIIMWYMVPLFELSFQLYVEEWKLTRYFLPIVPCFALISAMGLEYILTNKRIKNAALCFIFAAGLLQYFNSSFNSNMYKQVDERPYRPKIDISHKVYIDSFDTAGAIPPYRTDWKHGDIAGVFAKHIIELGGYPLLVNIVIDDEGGIGLKKIFGNKIMNYYFTKEMISSNVDFGSEIFLDLKEPGREREWAKENKKFVENMPNVTGLLYISRKNEWPSMGEFEHFFNAKEMSEQIVNFINSRAWFYLVDKIPLPEGYYAHIYLCKVPEIRSGDLSVKVHNGNIKIFDKDKEITKDMGITSEFVYNGRVYKNKESEILTYKEDSGKVAMVSKWPSLGIIQTTIVSMDPEREGTLNIKINIESEEGVTIEQWYVNSLISNEYREWMRPFSKGVFKEITEDSDSDKFEALDLDYEGSNIVGIHENIEKGLPSILFRAQSIEVPIRAGVSNTNYYHNSRCVYVTADAKIKLEPWTRKDILDMDITVMDGKELTDIISAIEEGTF